MYTNSERRPDARQHWWRALSGTASSFARKWHPTTLVRLQRDGPLGYSELHDALGGISSEVLPGSLPFLESASLVDRHVVSSSPSRVQYGPTGQGRSLGPVLVVTGGWGDDTARTATSERVERNGTDTRGPPRRVHRPGSGHGDTDRPPRGPSRWRGGTSRAVRGSHEERRTGPPDHRRPGRFKWLNGQHVSNE